MRVLGSFFQQFGEDIDVFSQRSGAIVCMHDDTVICALDGCQLVVLSLRVASNTPSKDTHSPITSRGGITASSTFRSTVGRVTSLSYSPATGTILSVEEPVPTSAATQSAADAASVHAAPTSRTTSSRSYSNPPPATPMSPNRRVMSTSGVPSSLNASAASDASAPASLMPQTASTTSASTSPPSAAVVYGNWSSGRDHVKHIRLEHSGSCSAVAACPRTGNVAVASDTLITIHSVAWIASDADPDGKVLHSEPLLKLSPEQPPSRLAFYENMLAYASDRLVVSISIHLATRQTDETDVAVEPSTGISSISSGTPVAPASARERVCSPVAGQPAGDTSSDDQCVTCTFGPLGFPERSDPDMSLLLSAIEGRSLSSLPAKTQLGPITCATHGARLYQPKGQVSYPGTPKPLAYVERVMLHVRRVLSEREGDVLDLQLLPHSAPAEHSGKHDNDDNLPAAGLNVFHQRATKDTLLFMSHQSAGLIYALTKKSVFLLSEIDYATPQPAQAACLAPPRILVALQEPSHVQLHVYSAPLAVMPTSPFSSLSSCAEFTERCNTFFLNQRILPSCKLVNLVATATAATAVTGAINPSQASSPKTGRAKSPVNAAAAAVTSIFSSILDSSSADKDPAQTAADGQAFMRSLARHNVSLLPAFSAASVEAQIGAQYEQMPINHPVVFELMCLRLLFLQAMVTWDTSDETKGRYCQVCRQLAERFMATAERSHRTYDVVVDLLAAAQVPVIEIIKTIISDAYTPGHGVRLAIKGIDDGDLIDRAMALLDLLWPMLGNAAEFPPNVAVNHEHYSRPAVSVTTDTALALLDVVDLLCPEDVARVALRLLLCHSTETDRASWADAPVLSQFCDAAFLASDDAALDALVCGFLLSTTNDGREVALKNFLERPIDSISSFFCDWPQLLEQSDADSAASSPSLALFSGMVQVDATKLLSIANARPRMLQPSLLIAAFNQARVDKTQLLPWMALVCQAKSVWCPLSSTERKSVVLFLLRQLLSELTEPDPQDTPSWTLQLPRHAWLDSLPPFAPSITPEPSAPAAKLSVLRRAQSLLSRRLEDTYAADGLALVDAQAESYAGKTSLQMLCLAACGRYEEALMLLMNASPAHVIEFLDTFVLANNKHGAASSLFNSVLSRLEEQIRLQASQETPNGKALLVAYQRILQKAAISLELDAFVELLPQDGNAAFFLPFIQTAHRAAYARQLSKSLYDADTLVQAS